MKLRRISIVLSPILLIGLLPASSLQAASGVQFTIVYTNDVMGEVEPCG